MRLSIGPRSDVACALLALALFAPVVRAQTFEDAPLVRHPENPLLTKGPTGSIDQLKIGPRAVLREGPSDWKLWYEAVPSGNKSFTALATSEDGVVWTRYAGNPVMEPSAAWEGGTDNPEGEVSPTSVLREDGLYKIWYHGIEQGTRRIGYATSPDGINWTKHPNNPVLSPGPPGSWDADSICEPQVLRVGELYFMYYAHCAGSHGIGLATSADGVTWTKYEGNPVLAAGSGWEDKQVAWGEVYYDGEAFHLWYPGTSFAASATGGHSLGYAYSEDGKLWTRSPDNPVMSPWDALLDNPDYAVNLGDADGLENRPNVLRRGNEWWIYYGGFAFCCPEDATLCLATAPVQGAPNKAPVVDAGADQSLPAPGSVMLDGTVMDDDVPVALGQVSATWSKQCGPGEVQFDDPSAIDTRATFDVPGSYVLALLADDGDKQSRSEVSVVVGQASAGCEAGPTGGTSGGAGGAGAGPTAGDAGVASDGASGANTGTSGANTGTSGAKTGSTVGGAGANPTGTNDDGSADADVDRRAGGGCAVTIPRLAHSAPATSSPWLVLAALAIVAPTCIRRGGSRRRRR